MTRKRIGPGGGKIIGDAAKAAGREIASAGGEIGREAARRVGRYVRPRIRSIGVPLPSLQVSDTVCGPADCNPFLPCGPPGCPPARE